MTYRVVHFTDDGAVEIGYDVDKRAALRLMRTLGVCVDITTEHDGRIIATNDRMHVARAYPIDPYASM
jgi:hypothetical protein